jgi:protein required for attachment to host cells
MDKQIRLGSILAQYAELLRTNTEAEIEALMLSARDKRLEEMRKEVKHTLTWEEIEKNLILGKPRKELDNIR